MKTKLIALATVAVFAFGAPAFASDSFDNHGGNNNPPPVTTPAPAAPTIQQSASNGGPVTNVGVNQSGALNGNFTVQANQASGASNSISRTSNNVPASSTACACASVADTAVQVAVNTGGVSNNGNNAAIGSLNGVASAQVNSATGAGNSDSAFSNVAMASGHHH